MIETPKPSQIRKYIFEYVVIFLAAAVVTLFYMFMDLNKYIREDMVRLNIETKEAIIKNNQTLSELITNLKQNKHEQSN
ncbi:MAG TPA: hypothetical protein VF487_13180 [Chitinophagaceae bacterium]